MFKFYFVIGGIKTMTFLEIERKKMTLEFWSEILPWRNDPRVRIWSKTNRVVSYQEHLAWFQQRSTKLDNEPIFAYFANSTFIGMVRLDQVAKNSLEVSLIINPEYRGRGFGARILHDVCKYFVAMKSAEMKLTAVIHSENLASLALFSSSGFTKVTEQLPFVFLELNTF